MFRIIIKKSSSFMPRFGNTSRHVSMIRSFSTVNNLPKENKIDTIPHTNFLNLQKNKTSSDFHSKYNTNTNEDYKTSSEKLNDQASSESSQKETFKNLLLYLLSIISIISFYPLLLEDKDERGFYLARWARKIWSMMDCKINARDHHYQFTLPVCKATEIITEDSVFDFFAEEASIGCTVPGAFKGKDNSFFAGRENDGTATAIFLGNVTTINNSKHRTIINKTLPDHLLHNNDTPGTVTMRFFKQGDYIFIEVTGKGSGNFAYLNEIFAEPIFKRILRTGIDQHNIIYSAK